MFISFLNISFRVLFFLVFKLGDLLLVVFFKRAVISILMTQQKFKLVRTNNPKLPNNFLIKSLYSWILIYAIYFQGKQVSAHTKYVFLLD